MVAALIATGAADVTFRDPDHIAVLYVLEVWAGVALLVGLDIFLRARKLTGTRWPSRAAMGAVRRERWTPFRIGAVAVAIVAFYASYLAYRNLKSVVPLLRPEDLFDAQLADIDRVMFLGNDPATLLHSLFGTGISAHVISALYIAFIVFLPLSLGVALVFAERLKASLFYAAALGLNWIIGAATYLLVPALGPIYFYPQWFSDLPHTETTRLQDLLMSDRVAFLADPATGTPQAIAAFVSLHIAMSFTALAAAYLLRSRTAPEARTLDLAGDHHDRDRVPGLALLHRRRRGRRSRDRGSVPCPRDHRLRPSDRALRATRRRRTGAGRCRFLTRFSSRATRAACIRT